MREIAKIGGYPLAKKMKVSPFCTVSLKEYKNLAMGKIRTLYGRHTTS